MPPSFTPSHRGGSGSPLVCLHGFTDTWRTWELVLPGLEREHDVLAPTLRGHAGAEPIAGPITEAVLADGVEAAMDEAGFTTAHIVGNSLGGFVALQLAARGRAKSVVALAPAGGWAEEDASYGEMLDLITAVNEQVREIVPFVDEIVSTPDGRRRATELLTTNYEHLPAELIAHQMRGAAGCEAADALLAYARREGWHLDAERIECPVRFVWGTDDKLLRWPSAAARFRDEWLPEADWVVLDGVGHCPQLDVPLETGQLIAGFTA